MSRFQSSSGLSPLPLSGCHSLIRLGLDLLFVLIAICLCLLLRLNILRQFVPDPIRPYPFIWDLKLSVYLFNGHSTSFKPANVTHKFASGHFPHIRCLAWSSMDFLPVMTTWNLVWRRDFQKSGLQEGRKQNWIISVLSGAGSLCS